MTASTARTSTSDAGFAGGGGIYSRALRPSPIVGSRATRPGVAIAASAASTPAVPLAVHLAIRGVLTVTALSVHQQSGPGRQRLHETSILPVRLPESPAAAIANGLTNFVATLTVTGSIFTTQPGHRRQRQCRSLGTPALALGGAIDSGFSLLTRGRAKVSDSSVRPQPGHRRQRQSGHRRTSAAHAGRRRRRRHSGFGDDGHRSATARSTTTRPSAAREARR